MQIACCCSVAKLCLTLCNPMDCSTPGFPVLCCFPVCSNLWPLSWWCHSTISSSVAPFYFCPQSFPARVFSNKSALRIWWPKCWSFSISPSNEYSRLISFRIDWLDILAVQGTLKNYMSISIKRQILFDWIKLQT